MIETWWSHIHGREAVHMLCEDSGGVYESPRYPAGGGRKLSLQMNSSRSGNETLQGLPYSTKPS